MKRLIYIVLFASSLLVAKMGYNMPSFNDFDANKDGKITKSEFETFQQNRMMQKAKEGKMMRNAGNAPTFSDIDANSDGVVDMSEFKMHQQSNMKK